MTNFRSNLEPLTTKTLPNHYTKTLPNRYFKRKETPELEKTPEDQKRRKSRKYYAVKTYYNNLKNSNEITNNPIEDLLDLIFAFKNSNMVIENHYPPDRIHLPIQSQFVQKHHRKNYNLARSTIDNFKPTVIYEKHVVRSRHKSCFSPLGNAPESIIKLLIQDSLTTEELYLKYICSFNSIFSFTSMGASIDPKLANGAHGVYTYHLQGAIYHQIGQPIMLRFLSSQDFDIRHYNRSTANKIAVLLIDNNAD
ncbi:19398_t:CDS:2, partial [Gigaspora margarita]